MITGSKLRHVLRAFAVLLALLVSASAGMSQSSAAAPGLPNRAFAPEQVLRVVGRLNAENGAPQEHSSVVFHQGYIVEVYSEENDRPRGGIAVFDLTDPAAPRLVARTERDTGRLSEQHSIAFSRVDGRDLVALLAIDGVEIWDWTDLADMHRVGRLTLPGIEVGYGLGAWWLAWQMPYLYVSGASNGLYIVDTSDPAAPRLIDRGAAPNPLPTAQIGGFRAGPVFAVGNLLVLSANDGRGYATLDIGDPTNPVLLDAEVEGSPPSYSSMLNGNRLYAVGTDDDLHAFDLSSPMEIRRLDSVAIFGRGGYLTIQDHLAHAGASDHYVKVDVSDPDDLRVVGSATSGIPNRDEDFVTVLGNLAIVSDDAYNGTFIVPHQAEPDTTGPLVNMVVPADGAANQSRASRIGLTFTDRIDGQTIAHESIVVRPLGGEPLRGRFSHQTGIVNFTPDRPLEPDQIYEVIVPKGGVRDVAGNPVPTEYRSTFSTGDSVGSGLWCEVSPSAPLATGQRASFTARLVEGSVTTAFTWDFGDGSGAVEEAPGAAAGHVYARPGHYTVRATVAAGSRTTSCAARITVHRPLPPGSSAAAAASTSTIILDSTGAQVWNVNPDQNTVTATDAVNLRRMFEVPVGRGPRTLALAPDGTIWVANQVDATISVLDPGSGAQLAKIPLPAGSEPYGIVFSPARAAAFVSLQATGQLARLDAPTRSVAEFLEVGPAPRALAFTSDGQRLFVTRYISPVDRGELVEVNPNTLTVVRRIPLDFVPGPDTESSGRGVPNGLTAAVVAPDGHTLWAPARKHNTARGAQRDGQPLNFESTVRSMLARIDLKSSREMLELRYDFNNRDGPVAVRLSPLGDYVFVALEGSNAIDVIDAYSGELAASIEDVGAAPQGLLFTSDGSKLFVHSWLTRALLVYDVSGLLQPTAGSARLIAELPVVVEETLDPLVLAGKRIFYNARDPRMDRDEYIACASCHLDSRDDGRVWDRTAEGEGLRNTISLVGRGRAGHGRLHWTANFDEVQDFENDIRASFGGAGFLPEALWMEGSRRQTLGDPKAGLSAELDALAQYVASLQTIPTSPARTTTGALTPDAEKGKTLFLTLGCPACHGGQEFTDSPTSVLHDVGTLTPASGQRLGQDLRGLDTPSLRGLWLSAPYLHDGSAPTLYDVFTTRNTRALHGDFAAALSADPRALDHLVAYLLALDDREPGLALAAPAVELAHPVAGTVLPAGASLEIAVNTAPTLGSVERVEFLADSTVIGEDRTVIYAYTWHNPPPGVHLLQARLVYANGASTTSAPVRVEVLP